jgi:hypothetical protein
MWRYSHLLVVVSVLFAVACSSGDNGGTTGPVDTRQRVQAYVTTSVPATDDPFDQLWDSVDVDTVPLRRSGSIINSIAALPTHCEVQVIRTGEKLFIRCGWSDPELHLQVKPWRVTATDGRPRFRRDSLAYDFGEDQLLIMFDGAPLGGWDTWRWMAYRTGTVGLAEGLTYRNGSFTVDAHTAAIYRDNFVTEDSLPKYVSINGPAFVGDTLYLAETSEDPGSFVSGWTFNQLVPGYVIDSAAARQVKANPQSRWDILAAWDYDAAEGYHTVVLSRKLNTGFAPGEDLNMAGLDSVAVRIGMLDDLPDLLPNNSSQQAFTSELVLKLQ